MFLRIALILLLTTNFAFAKHEYNEKYYQNIWCKENNGISEYKLIDNTRVDCLTKTQAVEFDFAPKWAEAIGQSLHYAKTTKREPAIVLIIEKEGDFKYLNKIKPLCDEYKISLSYVEKPKEPVLNKQALFIEDIFDLIINFIMNFICQFLKTLLP